MRELLLHNVWLKVTSLVLATLIWLTVDATLNKQTIAAYQTLEPADDWDGREISERLFDLPVQVGASPDSWPGVMTSPRSVKITLRGAKRTMRELQAHEIRAFVDTPKKPTEEVVYPVQVMVPPGSQIVRIIPPVVLIKLQ